MSSQPEGAHGPLAWPRSPTSVNEPPGQRRAIQYETRVDRPEDLAKAVVAYRRGTSGAAAPVLLGQVATLTTGNPLPATVKPVCVDINPAVVTKLTDRGTFQAIGLVTDVEPFLRALCQHLDEQSAGAAPS